MSTDTSTDESPIDGTGHAPPVRRTLEEGGLRARMRASWQWPRRELVAFLAVAVLVLIAVSAGAALISERIARVNALEEAGRSVDRLANLLVAPLMPGVLAGDPEELAELERVITNRMSDGSLLKVVIWTADGVVVWADDPTVIGGRFPTTPELLSAAVDGATIADVEENPEADTVQPPAGGQMVEVYVPLRLADRDDLAFEAYLGFEGVDRQAARLRGEIIPMAVGALVILQLVQIPIAASLTRRIGRQERDRTRLIERNFTASERERRAIAGDVHDGPVQDLAGVSYALSALRPSMPAPQQATMDRLVGAVRHAVLSLRRLMIDIYPTDLSGPGLGVAIDDLVGPLRDHGVTVHVDVGPQPQMSSEAAAVVYRTAKEALVNVAHHAGAHTVWVRLETYSHQDRPAVRLSVSDDGVGLPATGINRRAEGHLGLRLVIDRVDDLGGTVAFDERPGGGAAVIAVVPLEHPA